MNNTTPNNMTTTSQPYPGFQNYNMTPPTPQQLDNALNCLLIWGLNEFRNGWINLSATNPNAAKILRSTGFALAGIGCFTCAIVSLCSK